MPRPYNVPEITRTATLALEYMPIMAKPVIAIPGAMTATEPNFCEIFPMDNLATAMAMAFALKNTPRLLIPFFAACTTRKVRILLANMIASMIVDGLNAPLSTIFSHIDSF
jgi:hypothetical protein